MFSLSSSPYDSKKGGDMRTSKIKLALGALASIAPGVATAQTPLTYSGGGPSAIPVFTQAARTKDPRRKRFDI